MWVDSEVIIEKRFTPEWLFPQQGAGSRERAERCKSFRSSRGVRVSLTYGMTAILVGRPVGDEGGTVRPNDSARLGITNTASIVSNRHSKPIPSSHKSLPELPLASMEMAATRPKKRFRGSVSRVSTPLARITISLTQCQKSPADRSADSWPTQANTRQSKGLRRRYSFGGLSIPQATGLSRDVHIRGWANGDSTLLSNRVGLLCKAGDRAACADEEQNHG